MDTREIIMFPRACARAKSIMSRQPSQSHLLVLSGVSNPRPLQPAFFRHLCSLSAISRRRPSAFHFSPMPGIVMPPPQTRAPSRSSAAITTKQRAVTVGQDGCFFQTSFQPRLLIYPRQPRGGIALAARWLLSMKFNGVFLVF